MIQIIKTFRFVYAIVLCTLLIVSCGKGDDDRNVRYRLKKVIDGDHTPSYEYDAQGRVSKAGNTSYHYGANGKIEKIITPNQSSEDHSYNPDGSLKEILVNYSNGGASRLELQHIMRGTTLAISKIDVFSKNSANEPFAHSLSLDFNYNARHLVSEMVSTELPSGDINRYIYDYDQEGNLSVVKGYNKRNNRPEYLQREAKYQFNDKVSIYAVPGRVMISSEIFLLKYHFAVVGLDAISPNFCTRAELMEYHDDGTVRSENIGGIYGEFNEVGYPVKVIFGGDNPILYEYERF